MASVKEILRERSIQKRKENSSPKRARESDFRRTGSPNLTKKRKRKQNLEENDMILPRLKK